MANAGEAVETAEGLGYEKVWAMFREIAERQAETGKQIRELSKEADRRQAETALQMQETDRKMQETDRKMRETDRQIQETALQMRETDRKMQETDRIVKELSKNIGGLHNALGKWTEELVSAKLWEKFNEMGYKFTHGGPRKFWEGSRTVAQVDMLLENGEYAMPVEIKSELSIGDVDVHIERIERVREQLDKRGDKRKLVGAIAGMVVGEAARKYAQEKGLYVLEQSGDMVEVADAPEGFKAREW